MNKIFSGRYGLVLIPDTRTVRKAYSFARSLAPTAEYLVEKPHVTLYYANLSNVKEDVIIRLLKSLRFLEGQPLKLHELKVVGGKFLFWNIIKTPNLKHANEEALELAKFLDHQMKAPALEEGLSLTNEELDSLHKFGHPMMSNLYLPHITLAYDTKGIFLKSHPPFVEFDMHINQVSFVEFGQYGILKSIIEL